MDSNSDQNSSPQTFADKEIDASINAYCWLIWLPCTFGVIPYKSTLLLDREEVTKNDVDLCGSRTSKRPYAELGSVDRSNCLCFVSVDSALGSISPGCGCSGDRVDEIVTELKGRMRQRGDTAQIKRAEEIIKHLDEVDAKLDLILDHLQIPRTKKMTDRDSMHRQIQ